MTLFISLVGTAILAATLVLLAYRHVQKYFHAMKQRYSPNRYWSNLLQFAWRILKGLGLIWVAALSLLMVILSETGPLAELSVWNISDYPLVIPDWIRMWSIVLLPGIPAIMSIGNYVASHMRGKNAVLHGGNATYTNQNDTLGMIVAVLLITLVISIVSSLIAAI